MAVALIVEEAMEKRALLKNRVQGTMKGKGTVLTCENSTQAVELAKIHRLDAVIVTPVPHGSKTWTVLQQIEAFQPCAKFVVLGLPDDSDTPLVAVNYLPEPEALDTLMEHLLRPSGSIHKEKHYCLKISTAYIKRHFKEKLSLEKVAAQVYMTPKSFSHFFIREMGFPFTEYIVKLRVEHACRLLETTRYPAYKISAECGYADPAYFNRVFSAQMKMTPHTYRKKMFTRTNG